MSSWKIPLLEDLGYIVENKDRLLDKIEFDDPEQREEVKSFFRKYPHLESKFDWNNADELTYENFAELMQNYTSKTAQKKERKSVGLEKLLSFPNTKLIFHSGDGKFAVYIGSYEASEYCGRSGKKDEENTHHWCVSKSASHWDNYTAMKESSNRYHILYVGKEFIFIYNPNSAYPQRKIMWQQGYSINIKDLDLKLEDEELWDQEDDNDSTVPADILTSEEIDKIKTFIKSELPDIIINKYELQQNNLKILKEQLNSKYYEMNEAVTDLVNEIASKHKDKISSIEHSPFDLDERNYMGNEIRILSHKRNEYGEQQLLYEFEIDITIEKTPDSENLNKIMYILKDTFKIRSETEKFFNLDEMLNVINERFVSHLLMKELERNDQWLDEQMEGLATYFTDDDIAFRVSEYSRKYQFFVKSDLLNHLKAMGNQPLVRSPLLELYAYVGNDMKFVFGIETYSYAWSYDLEDIEFRSDSYDEAAKWLLDNAKKMLTHIKHVLKTYMSRDEVN